MTGLSRSPVLVLVLLCLLISWTSCQNIDEIMNKMTLKQKIGQMIQVRPQTPFNKWTNFCNANFRDFLLRVNVKYLMTDVVFS
jgi:hypothetical protein